MEPLVDTVIEDARWLDVGLAPLAEAAAVATLTALGVPVAGFSICVMGCDDARIAALNADFRGKPVPTNVLSWPSDQREAEDAGTRPDLPAPGSADDPESLGDIALAFETCTAEASAAGQPVPDHVTHLIVHGVLHLLGYDHIDDADAELMETTEIKILASLGIADPYN